MERHYGLIDAVNALDEKLQIAESDLSSIAHRLEQDFSSSDANPMKLASRISKLSADMPALRQECESLLSSKKSVVDTLKLLNKNQQILLDILSKIDSSSSADDSLSAAVEDAVSKFSTQFSDYAAYSKECRQQSLLADDELDAQMLKMGQSKPAASAPPVEEAKPIVAQAQPQPQSSLSGGAVRRPPAKK